jgi:hypothetical protein
MRGVQCRFALHRSCWEEKHPGVARFTAGHPPALYDAATARMVVLHIME